VDSKQKYGFAGTPRTDLLLKGQAYAAAPFQAASTRMVAVAALAIGPPFVIRSAAKCKKRLDNHARTQTSYESETVRLRIIPILRSQ